MRYKHQFDLRYFMQYLTSWICLLNQPIIFSGHYDVVNDGVLSPGTVSSCQLIGGSAAG